MDAERAVKLARDLGQPIHSRPEFGEGAAAELRLHTSRQLRPHLVVNVCLELRHCFRIRLAFLESEIRRHQLRLPSSRLEPVHVEAQFVRGGQGFGFVQRRLEIEVFPRRLPGFDLRDVIVKFFVELQASSELHREPAQRQAVELREQQEPPREPLFDLSSKSGVVASLRERLAKQIDAAADVQGEMTHPREAAQEPRTRRPCRRGFDRLLGRVH